MQCFHPIVICGPDYSGPVPCGKCFACQSNRRKEWHMRIKYEMLHSLFSLTVTLTYDDDHLPSMVLHSPKDPLKFPDFKSYQFWYHPFDIDHVQRYFKRLRKKYSFRYFGVAEYGGKRGRPHYHVIFFFNDNYSLLQLKTDIVKEWYYGSQITIDNTNDDCIGYTLKYCLKPFTSIDPSPRIFLSKRPYIGNGFASDSVVDYIRTSSDDLVTTINGKQRLPRIYREKFLDDDMKARNKDSLLKMIDSKRISDEKFAHDHGMSYNTLLCNRRDYFVASCWKSIKKKTL